MFDAVVRSNGWDDATVALQLLSHLEGDALNGAGGTKSHAGWVGQGTDGAFRIARRDYRCQFEKTARHEGEDPSIFAIDLETLVVKTFGDMGPNARLQLIRIRDQFIAGHKNCALRHHLSGTLLTGV